MKPYTKIVVAFIIIVLALCVHTVCLAKTVTVNTETLKLRAEPSTESAVIRLLSIGDELTYLEEVEGWVKIEFEGSTGYVSKDYVKIEGEEEPAQEETPTQTPETTPEPTTEQTPQESEPEQTIHNSYQIKNACSMYILPLINASQIYTFTPGVECTVITEQNGWVYVQTSQIDGWLRKDNIEEKTQSTTPPQEETPTQTPQETEPEQPVTTFAEKTMYVSEDSIFVRSGPGTNYEVVEYLAKDDEVTVKGEEGDWYQVTVSGKDGYIAKWLLTETVPELTSRGGEVQRLPEETQTTSQEQSTPVETSSQGEQIVEYAKQFLGCPYVYGGSGPNYFDCSGFTMYVYQNFGVSLTHSATAQSSKGTYVPKEELQLGDLVFFKDYETMDGIGHCGIYIGEGNFIHASSGTGYCVKISTLLTGSYNTRYETARRII